MTGPPLKVELPWPPQALSPNARKHRMAVAKVKKKYRADCGWATLAAGVRRISAPGLRLHIRFIPPTARNRDRDNMIAAIKSGLDGVADVIGIDDSRWVWSQSVGAPEAPGRVELTLEPLYERPE